MDVPTSHALGQIDIVTLDDTPVLSTAVPFHVPTIRAAWIDFENGLDSLDDRALMGLFRGEGEPYHLAATRLEGDDPQALRLDETVIPGGRYLRLQLRGEAPGVYDQLSDAFDVLFEHADHDRSRPQIEHFLREGEVDCLVPIHTRD